MMKKTPTKPKTSIINRSTTLFKNSSQNAKKFTWKRFVIVIIVAVAIITALLLVYMILLLAAAMITDFSGDNTERYSNQMRDEEVRKLLRNRVACQNLGENKKMMEKKNKNNNEASSSSSGGLSFFGGLANHLSGQSFLCEIQNIAIRPISEATFGPDLLRMYVRNGTKNPSRFKYTIGEFPKTLFGQNKYQTTIEVVERNENENENDDWLIPSSSSYFFSSSSSSPSVMSKFLSLFGYNYTRGRSSSSSLLSWRNTARVVLEDIQKESTKLSSSKTTPIVFLFAPHYLSHVTHFSEPLQAFIETLETFLIKNTNTNDDDDNEKNSEQEEEEDENIEKKASNKKINSFQKLGAVLIPTVNSDPLEQDKLSYAMLRASMFAAYKRAGLDPKLSLQVPIIGLPDAPVVIPRLYVGGNRYNIFRDQSSGIRFREDLRDYFEFVDEQNNNNNNNEKLPPSLSSSHHDPTISNRKKNMKKQQQLVYAKRIANTKLRKRYIVDEDNFVELLKLICKQVNVELIIVEAGKYSVQDLYKKIKDARILLSLHGADITNEILLPVVAEEGGKSAAAAAVIEVNPLIFWEPRFPTLSDSINISYFSWNCNSPLCGGVAAFRENIMSTVALEGAKCRESYCSGDGKLTFDRKSFNISFSSKKLNFKNCRWPALNLVPHNCVGGDVNNNDDGVGSRNSKKSCCDDLVGRTSIAKKFYGKLRDSPVRVVIGRHAIEIVEILFQAFRKVGFVLSVEKDGGDDDGDDSHQETEEQVKEKVRDFLKRKNLFDEDQILNQL